MIIRTDETWATIQCPECEDCYKVMKDKVRKQQHCPYCPTIMIAGDGEAAEEG